MRRKRSHTRQIMSLWESIPGHRGMSVLDAGAGKGLTTRMLLDLGMKPTATTFGTERDERLPPEAAHVGGVDLNARWPFADASFDGINLKDVFEHLENPAHVVRECARILKPGGYLVLSTPNILNAGSRLRLFATGFFQGWKRPLSYAKEPGNADNVYMTNLHQLHYLLAQSGMSWDAMAADPAEWHALLTAAVCYPLFWLGAWLATARVRRKDMLFTRDREDIPEAKQEELRGQQAHLQRRLRKLLLSREALLSRNLLVRARKTGGSPFDA